MKSKEEFIREFREKRAREDQERVQRYRAARNQERLLSKMGMRLRVSKPPEK